MVSAAAMDLAIAFLIPFKASVLSSPTIKEAAGREGGGVGGGGGGAAARGGGDLAFTFAAGNNVAQMTVVTTFSMKHTVMSITRDAR